MSASPTVANESRGAGIAWDWALAACGWVLLFAPTYLDLAREVWTDPHEAHGPFILAIAGGALYARRGALAAATACPSPVMGLMLLGLGLVFYVLGRSQEFLVLETAAQIPVLAGLILSLSGWAALKRLWFAPVFLLFSVVWPTWAIDTLTLPLKQAATHFTLEVLYALGYPVASSGVIIAVGPYQLLVADACSGLNTIISLLSVGVLYLYISRYDSPLRNAAVLVATPFIAFAANMLRVMVLTLITYHFGQAAGQGFLHDFTGVFLFGVALGGIFLFDGAIGLAQSLMRGLPQRRGVRA